MSFTHQCKNKTPGRFPGSLLQVCPEGWSRDKQVLVSLSRGELAFQSGLRTQKDVAPSASSHTPPWLGLRLEASCVLESPEEQQFLHLLTRHCAKYIFWWPYIKWPNWGCSLQHPDEIIKPNPLPTSRSFISQPRHSALSKQLTV
jgi:hypothetical protein